MNASVTSSLRPEQIAAEVAEMRKASNAILASPAKCRAFLRRVGAMPNGANEANQSKGVSLTTRRP